MLTIIIMLYFTFLVLIYPIIRSLYLLTTQHIVAQLVKNLPANLVHWENLDGAGGEGGGSGDRDGEHM